MDLKPFTKLYRSVVLVLVVPVLLYLLMIGYDSYQVYFLKTANKSDDGLSFFQFLVFLTILLTVILLRIVYKLIRGYLKRNYVSNPT